MDETGFEGYLPIPVDAARRIANNFRKDWVIILAYDAASDKTHSTTFGESSGAKYLAADLADICLKAIGLALGPLDGGLMAYEDFRLKPEGVAAKEIADLQDGGRAANSHARGDGNGDPLTVGRRGPRDRHHRSDPST